MNSPVHLGRWEPSTDQRKVRDGMAAIFEVAPHALIGRGRRRPLVEYRQIAMWVVRECFPGLSYPMIGVLFGGRDHSTIIYGCRQIEYRRERDPDFETMTDAIRDGFGVRRAGVVVDATLLERIADVTAACRPAEAGPAPRLPAPVRQVMARNDFAEDDCDARKRAEASDALGKALRREGAVCR